MSTKPWIKTLRYQGMFWLRYERQCVIVSCERPPYHENYHPDILGITRGRQFVEIEIKVSASDLRSDKEKRRHDPRLENYHNPAHRFYYIVPPKLEEIAMQEIESRFGIIGMRYGDGSKPADAAQALQCSATVLRNAQTQNKPKATLAQCVRMAENVSATCVSLAKEIAVQLNKM